MKDTRSYNRFVARDETFAWSSLCSVMMVFAAMLMTSVDNSHAQTNTGIGTVAPNASALLDLTSTAKGFLVPRMTQATRNLIATPATGDLVYCLDSTALLTPTGFYYYTGTQWVPIEGYYLNNYLSVYGVLYGPASQQNTLAAGATPIFNVAYAAASGASVTDFGAQIVSNASGATAGSATGLTVTAVGSGAATTATGLIVSATGAAGDTSINATGKIAENTNSIATTSTDGLMLQNTTAATNAVKQQYSPRIDLTGTAYNSTGAVSQTDKFIIENQPQTVAGTTTENLVTSSSIAGGAFGQVSSLSSGGTLTLGNPSALSGALSLATSTASFLTTFQQSATTPTSSFIYKLPSQTAAPTAGQVLSITSVTGAGPYTVNLQWGTSASSYTHFVSSVDSIKAITSTTGLMGGLDITFTPVVTGHMYIIMSGDMYTSATGASATTQMYYGTGTPPVHAAALTGTAVAGKITVQPVAAPHVEVAPFMITTYQALTVGTTYWVDAAVSGSSSSTSLGQVVVTAIELP
jgi:hypothetical protein